MDATITAALVASVSTLVATLGTQALGNRREAQRQQRQLNENRVEELRSLLEEAAVELHAGAALIRQLSPIPEVTYEPPTELVDELGRVVQRLELIDTRLGIRIHFLLLNDAMRAFHYSVRGIRDAHHSIRVMTLDQEGFELAARQFGEAKRRAADGLLAFQSAVAWSMGPKLGEPDPAISRLRRRAVAHVRDLPLVRRFFRERDHT